VPARLGRSRAGGGNRRAQYQGRTWLRWRGRRGLWRSAGFVLVDAADLPPCPVPPRRHQGRADQSVHRGRSIRRQSHRDRLMARLDGSIPAMVSPATPAIPTAAHRAALKAKGTCPEHRRSFAPGPRLPRQLSLLQPSLDGI